MLTCKAPAKINWTLHVLQRRNDGYHDIVSLMQCVDLCDTLTFEHSDDVVLVSDMNLPHGHNLVFRAASALREATGYRRGARIGLVKEIPSGAGLGGGSSDAATTLLALNRFWNTGLEEEDLAALGAALGSDVPFFVRRQASVAEGRGERLSPVEMPAGRPLLIVKPPVSVPTAWAYGALAKRRREATAGDLTNGNEKLNNIKLIIGALGEGDYSRLGSMVRNDFEGVVIERYPVIGDIKRRLLDAGAAVALMSGSGSAVFGLFADRGSAEVAARRFPSYWVRVAVTLHTDQREIACPA